MNEVRYWIRRFRSAFFYGPEVLTRHIILTKVALLLVYGILLIDRVPQSYFLFSTTSSLSHPWTFLLYPIATDDLLEFIFASYWFWVVSGSIERSFPKHVYVRLVLSVTLIASLALFAASQFWSTLGVDFLGNTNVFMIGLWMPNAALTICWIYLNPHVILFPNTPFELDARKLFWIVVGLIILHFAFMQQAPLLALFPLASIYYALQFMKKRSFVPSASTLNQSGPDPIGSAKRWIFRHFKKLVGKLFFRR